MVRVDRAVVKKISLPDQGAYGAVGIRVRTYHNFDTTLPPSSPTARKAPTHAGTCPTGQDVSIRSRGRFFAAFRVKAQGCVRNEKVCQKSCARDPPIHISTVLEEDPKCPSCLVLP